MDIWSLPRPASFIDEIEYSIRDGSNVIARFPTFVPSGLEQVLQDRLDSLFEWTVVDASTSRSGPVAFLREQICPEVREYRASTMTELANTAEFQGRLVWVKGIAGMQWPDWAAALSAYADACRNVDLVSRTIFVVVLLGDAIDREAPEQVALVQRDFRDVVDALELFTIALCRLSDASPDRDQCALLAHVVSQVARWDCALAEELISLSPEEILYPEAALVRYAKRRGWTNETTRSWESGTVDGPTDRPTVHSALLWISGETRLVRQRVWAAQAAVLLPLVEERRNALVPRCRRYLKLPVETEGGQKVYDPFELGMGQLAWHLERTTAPRAVKKQVRRLRDVRNKLAHMEPLDPEQALDQMLRSDL